MTSQTGSDWNDYAVQHGKAAVRQLVRAELSKQGIELPAELAKQATVTPPLRMLCAMRRGSGLGRRRKPRIEQPERLLAAPGSVRQAQGYDAAIRDFRAAAAA
jgi:hypothetical protein